MSSFNVESLLKNIPFNENIDIITSLVLRENVNVTNSQRNSSLNFYTCVLRINISSLLIRSNDSLKVCPWVIPIGSIFADIFLGYLEEKWLHECHINFKPFTDNSSMIFILYLTVKMTLSNFIIILTVNIIA